MKENDSRRDKAGQTIVSAQTVDFPMESEWPAGDLPPAQTRMEQRERERAAQKKEKRKGRWSFLLVLVIAVAIGVILRLFVVEFTRVEGASMEPTLYTGERLLVSKLDFKLGTPSRNDVVICHYPHYDGTYVKRVIGLPGETLEIRNGTIYIDGQPMAEHDFGVQTLNENMQAIQVPQDCVFLMGDNRDVSLDSRHPTVGPVPIGDLVGKAYAIVWPIDKIGGLS